MKRTLRCIGQNAYNGVELKACLSIHTPRTSPPWKTSLVLRFTILSECFDKQDKLQSLRIANAELGLEDTGWLFALFHLQYHAVITRVVFFPDLNNQTIVASIQFGTDFQLNLRSDAVSHELTLVVQKCRIDCDLAPVCFWRRQGLQESVLFGQSV